MCTLVCVREHASVHTRHIWADKTTNKILFVCVCVYMLIYVFACVRVHVRVLHVCGHACACGCIDAINATSSLPRRKWRLPRLLSTFKCSNCWANDRQVFPWSPLLHKLPLSFVCEWVSFVCEWVLLCVNKSLLCVSWRHAVLTRLMLDMQQGHTLYIQCNWETGMMQIGESFISECAAWMKQHSWHNQAAEHYVSRHMLIERTPPPPGGFPICYVPWSRTRRKRTPPEKSPPKLINFGGGSSGGVLFLRVLDQGT